jgi:hypothetical protein
VFLAILVVQVLVIDDLGVGQGVFQFLVAVFQGF